MNFFANAFQQKIPRRLNYFSWWFRVLNFLRSSLFSYWEFSSLFLYFDIIEIGSAWTGNWLGLDKNLMKIQRERKSFESCIECFDQNFLAKRCDIFLIIYKTDKISREAWERNGLIVLEKYFRHIHRWKIANVCALIDVIEKFEMIEMYQGFNLNVKKFNDKEINVLAIETFNYLQTCLKYLESFFWSWGKINWAKLLHTFSLRIPIKDGSDLRIEVWTLFYKFFNKSKDNENKLKAKFNL